MKVEDLKPGYTYQGRVVIGVLDIGDDPTYGAVLRGNPNRPVRIRYDDGDVAVLVAGFDIPDSWISVPAPKKEPRVTCPEHTDYLTGALNHRGLFDAIEEINGDDHTFESGHQVVVTVVDISNLRAFNREHGHVAGDALLKRTAAELESLTAQSAAIARVGSDSFVVVHDEQFDVESTDQYLAGSAIWEVAYGEEFSEALENAEASLAMEKRNARRYR